MVSQDEPVTNNQPMTAGSSFSESLKEISDFGQTVTPIQS
jgi:hypothetical protein